MTVQTRAPEMTPEVGQLVLVRSRRWLVEEVVKNGKGSPLIRLSCADDDAQGQSLDVYWWGSTRPPALRRLSAYAALELRHRY